MYSSLTCNEVLLQFFAEAEQVAMDVEGKAHCSIQEFWKNNPYLAGGAAKAHVAKTGTKQPRTEDANPVEGVMSNAARKKITKNLTLSGVPQATVQVIAESLKQVLLAGSSAVLLPLVRQLSGEVAYGVEAGLAVVTGWAFLHQHCSNREG